MVRLRSDRPNQIDAAVVAVGVATDHLLIDNPPLRIARLGLIQTGTERTFFYISDGQRVRCTHPQPIMSEIEIDYGHGLTLTFDNGLALEVLSGRPRQGHSGSLLCSEEDDEVRAYGIVFAGDDSRVLVNRLTEVLSTLSSRLAAEDGTEEDVSIGF
jgi:hypothetical protein